MMINRKKLLSSVLAVLFFVGITAQGVFASAPDMNNLAQKGVYIKEVVSDTLVYENNASQRYYPASITKLLTALTAMDYLDLDEVVTVGPEIYVIKAGSSLAHIKTGEKITFNDLLYAMMLPSGNDAANAIAASTAKKLKPNLTDFAAQNAYFCSLMNEKAKSLGAKDSNFVNPSGLHDDNHYTTAYDMYCIGYACLQNPVLMDVASKRAYQSGEHTWYSTNLLIQPSFDDLEWSKKQGPNALYSPYAKGLKTGQTIEARRTIVAYYEKDNLKVLAVVLFCGTEELFADANATLDYTTAHYEAVSFGKSDAFIAQLPLENTEKSEKTLNVLPKSDATVVTAKGAATGISHQIIYDNRLLYTLFDKYFIKKDIAEGEVIGKITIYGADKSELKSVDLLAGNNVVHDKYLFLRIALIFIVLLLIVLILLREGQKRYRRNKYERKNIQSP